MREDTRASAPANSRALNLHIPGRASVTAHENRYLESRALFARAPAPLATRPKLAAPDMNRGERRVKGPPKGWHRQHTIERQHQLLDRRPCGTFTPCVIARSEAG